MGYQPTSREAWEGFQPLSATLDDQILEFLAVRGPAICQVIELALKREHQSVSGNLRHLVERNMVEASGEYGMTHSGRRAIKWALTFHGRCVYAIEREGRDLREEVAPCAA